MLPDDEITSTEQLLTLIRNKDEQRDATHNGVVGETVSPESVKKIDPDSDHITVGVDIRENSITLVKIRPSSRTDWKLIDCEQKVFSPEKSTHSEALPAKELSKFLGEFIGNAKKYQIWAFVSSEKTNVRHILIPKVHKKQLSNTIFWSAKNEMGLDDSSFIDFEILGDITQKGIGKTAVMVYTVPKIEIKTLKNLFINAGFPLTGISMPEFSTQNLLRRDLLSGSGDTVATLSIRNTYSKISIYRRGNLTFTRRIKACLNSMSESLVDSIKESYFNLTQSDNHSLSVDYARDLLLKNISANISTQEIDSSSDTGIDQGNIFDGVLPALERLSRQIERTFQHFNSSFKEDSIKHLYIEGMVSRFKPLNQFVSEQLGITVSPLDVVTPGVPQFMEYKAQNQIFSGERFTPAIGLAISDYQSSNPNFLFDYIDKERILFNERVNKGILIGLTVIAILCFCLLFFQIIDSSNNKQEIKSLKDNLAEFGPRVDQHLILKEAARMKNLYKSQKKIASKYLGLATVTELIEKNPGFIRLNRIRLDMGPLATKKRRSVSNKIAIIEGTVFKEKVGQKGRDFFETSLANYMLALENSPIFSNPSIRGKEFEYIDRYGEVLIFELQINVKSQEYD